MLFSFLFFWGQTFFCMCGNTNFVFVFGQLLCKSVRPILLLGKNVCQFLLCGHKLVWNYWSKFQNFVFEICLVGRQNFPTARIINSNWLAAGCSANIVCIPHYKGQFALNNGQGRLAAYQCKFAYQARKQIYHINRSRYSNIELEFQDIKKENSRLQQDIGNAYFPPPQYLRATECSDRVSFGGHGCCLTSRRLWLCFCVYF